MNTASTRSHEIDAIKQVVVDALRDYVKHGGSDFERRRLRAAESSIKGILIARQRAMEPTRSTSR
jgi:hypothetical protein